jgi:hypothetical protein
VRLVRGEPASDRGAGHHGLSSDWLQGPVPSPGSIDVGVVTFAPGVTTPLHMHLVGHVPMVMAGEWHVHGADPRAALVHVSVSTGGNEIAGPAPG